MLSIQNGKESILMNAEKKRKIDKISIEKNNSMLEALKLMDREDKKLLLVTDKGTYYGILSIGDIQRAIISNISFDIVISEILRDKIRVARTIDDPESIYAMMMEFRTEFMPVLDEHNNLVNVYFWDKIYNEKCPPKRQINLPVVVMAGGKGTRLKPFSNIIPKPLFPLGEKTILEVILNKFHEVGCEHFFLSVNYKHEMIRAYIDQLDGLPYKLEWLQEKNFSGTAGSLNLLRGQINKTFFVTNCDIIINEDYSEIVDYHKKVQNDITIVAAIKHNKIPYGTISTGKAGELLSLEEKPESTYLINTGLYLLEPHVLDEIPSDFFLHITDLIKKVRRHCRVGVFPVREKSWFDIGEWQEYRRTMQALNFDFPV